MFRAPTAAPEYGQVKAVGASDELLATMAAAEPGAEGVLENPCVAEDQTTVNLFAGAVAEVGIARQPSGKIRPLDSSRNAHELHHAAHCNQPGSRSCLLETTWTD